MEPLAKKEKQRKTNSSVANGAICGAGKKGNELVNS
jgi:hypothetical protein